MKNKVSLFVASFMLSLFANPGIHAGQYFQDFSGVAVTATNFNDGSQLFSTNPGTVAGVLDSTYKELQLTASGTVNTRSAFLLPSLDTNAVGAFSVKWNAPVYGNFPTAGEGFSFTFGQVRELDLVSSSVAQEMGYSTGICFSVQTSANGTPGFYVRVNGAVAASQSYAPATRWGVNNDVRHFFEVDWNMHSGLTVRVDGQMIFTNVSTSAFTPSAGDSFVWAARTTSNTEYIRLDNVLAMTGGNLDEITASIPTFFSSQAPGRDATNIFDRNPATYWQATTANSGYVGGTISSPKPVALYALTSADTQGNDPSTWRLESSPDGTNWATLGNQGGAFVTRGETRSWNTVNAAPSSAWRLNVLSTANPLVAPKLADLRFWEFIPFGYPIRVIPPSADYGIINSQGNVYAPSISATIYPVTAAATVYFDWGTNSAYGNAMTLTNLSAGAPAATVAALLSSIPGDKDYHYRFRVETATATFVTPDAIFHVPNFSSMWVSTNPDPEYNTHPFLNGQRVNGSVTLADFSHGGRMDLFTEGNYSVHDSTTAESASQILINNFTRFQGQLIPLQRTPIFTSSTMGFPALGYTTVDDFNNDGEFDLLQSGSPNNAFSTTRIPATQLLTGIQPKKLAFNNPNFPVVVPQYISFDSAPTLPVGDWGRGGAVADFNGDGRMDVWLDSPSVLSLNRGHVRLAFVSPTLSGADNIDFLPLSSPEQGILSDSASAAGDYDNDGDMDLYIYQKGLYDNDGFGHFTPVNSGLPILTNGTGQAAWGDFDNDGRLDLVVSEKSATIFRNNGNGTFTDVDPGLPSSSGFLFAQLAWGDLDNDGDLDLVFSSSFPQVSFPDVPKVQVCLNQAGTFSLVNDEYLPRRRISFLLAHPYGGGAAVGDLNNDGRLDLIVNGADNISPDNYEGGMSIAINTMGPTNQPPSAPTGLSSVTTSGEVTLLWGNAVDDHTPSPALTYNIRVGTTSYGDDIVGALANTTNGLRYVPRMGNKQLAHLTKLRLPPGTYYWSVQAIDGAFAGGSFAAEQTFTVTNAMGYGFPVMVSGVTSNATTFKASAMTGYENGASMWVEYGWGPVYNNLDTSHLFTQLHPLINSPGDLNETFFVGIPATNAVSLNAVTNTVQNLLAGTHYRCRVVVSNSSGMFYGPHTIFNTLGESPIPVASGSSTNFPNDGLPGYAVDRTAASSYRNLDKTNAGLTIFMDAEVPMQTLTLISATNAPERDPASFYIDGSMDGTNFTRIASNDVPPFPARSTLQTFAFHNTNSWYYYRVIFPTVQDPALADSMQIGEVELLPYSLIGGPENSFSLILSSNATVITPPSTLVDNNLNAGTNKFVISSNAGVVHIDVTPSHGRTAMLGFEVISAAGSSANSNRYSQVVTIYGSDEPGFGAYTNLGTFSLTVPVRDMQLQLFHLANTNAFNHYRFDFGPQLTGSDWELGELRLFGNVINTAPPALSIELSDGQITLRWPHVPGFSLESATNLTTMNWDSVETMPIQTNGLNEITLPANSSVQFFRLKKL